MGNSSARSEESRGQTMAVPGTIRLLDRDDVIAALTSTALEPTPKSTDPTTGVTAELRNSMARFSPVEQHAARRKLVVDLIEGINPADVSRIATRQTKVVLTGDRIDALRDIAR